MRFYNIIQNYKWGVWLAIPIAIFILYFFPNDSETVPKFCSFGINKNNLPLVHRKSTLHLTTFNAEWLFDGINDPHRSFETADTHMNNIGKWLQGFPSAWWPRMTDDIFVLAVKFRCGIPICRDGDQCMRISCKSR